MTIRDPELTIIITPNGPPEVAIALANALAARGFRSVTGFADSRPVAALPALADELCEPSISWVLLERMLIDEAEARGTLERCARDLLARDLRSQLPHGWPGESTDSDDEQFSRAFHRTGVFHALTTAFPESYESAIHHIQRAMEDGEIPAGWLPTGADDPMLVHAFAAHWPPSPPQESKR